MESWSEILVYFYDAINIYVSLIPPKIIRSGGKGGGKEGERKKLSLIGKVFKLGIDFACIIDKIPH